MPPLSNVVWPKTHRIVRSRFPPIDLFEDIADPADWDAIASAEAKTNPRIAESIGMLDLVPDSRRIAGDGATWAMAPFVHVSTDRPSRFSDGTYGVYYAGNSINVALFETIHHHERFMASTDEEPGWTSDFRELVGTLDARLHDVRASPDYDDIHAPDDLSNAQTLASQLRSGSTDAPSDGIIYRSVRYPEGEAVALFWPDVAGIPQQGEHFSYYWNGHAVSGVKNLTTGDVFSIAD
jgi:hypothetical protein